VQCLMDDFDFKNPSYDAIYTERTRKLNHLRANPDERDEQGFTKLEKVQEYYKTHPVEFIIDWGMTFDPRNAEIGLPTSIPFIMFKRQREFIEYLYRKWRGREDGLTEKSRDMGVSWLCVAFACWMWLFFPGSVVGFGSRKEEYVDKIGDPKSLFWKVRQFLARLPVEFRPDGYIDDKHALFMRIINPKNEAAIVGEGGDNIGRGNRTSIYFKDESAFYQNPAAIDAALSQTSNCKIDVSTPNGNGNPFYRKRHGGKIEVFTFHWTMDPRKDEAWYYKQKDTLDPVILAQEVDMDYNASVADAFIHGQTILDAQRNGPADVDPIGAWIIGVDAAHFGNDESVVHCRKGRLNLQQRMFSKVDGHKLAGAVKDIAETLMDEGEEIFSIVIELDGPGVSCYDTLRNGPLRSITNGIHTGAQLADGKNWNIRAQIWRAARDYLKDAPVCMYNDPEVRAQLSSMKYKYKEGLLLMQDKKEYKKEFGRSPDRADGFVLTFAVEQVPKRERKGKRHNSRLTAMSV
jgi:phage terminase large subunit